ncbi:DNA primase [Halorubellus sp. PRR65]|uniref:DNA primase n=1 Tax=Halorubellus sp. PRR65 TaxID=3098148 RepID=UPI002B25CC76|nr:DNA primase [Halorubellus sp. PRR65]
MIWRAATQDEIQAYYRDEFTQHLAARPAHITTTGPRQYALAFREPYPTRTDGRPPRDFIRRDTRTADGQSEYFDHMGDVLDFIRNPVRNDPLDDLADPDTVDQREPVPDAVYYALDHWTRSWLIMVDIDAKDIARNRARHILEAEAVDPDDLTSDELFTKAGIRDGLPNGYPYEFTDIQTAIEQGFEVADVFETRFNAEETQVFYTGQGVHVYLYDDDPDHAWDAASREVLNTILTERYGIAVDEQVTADRRRVARLPGSLHADVSRIVTPIDSPRFDPRTDATPEFLA